MCVLRDSAIDGGRWIAHAPAAHPTCVGEASAEEDRRVEHKRYSNGHERCACYVTERLMEGDGAHAPAGPPACMGEASAEEDRMV